MPTRRFTPAEISSFHWEVAHGAKPVDVARKHGFSPSNFSRWHATHGRPHIRYEPTEADRAHARTWRQGKTLAQAWTIYRELEPSSRSSATSTRTLFMRSRLYEPLDGGTKLEVDVLRARPFVEQLRRRLPRAGTEPFVEELARRLRLGGRQR